MHSQHLTAASCSTYLKNDSEDRFPRGRVAVRCCARPAHAAQLGIGFDVRRGLRPHAADADSHPAAIRRGCIHGSRSSIPRSYVIDSDRLLYTCAYSVAFDPNARQCGLLLDEWTEVIPVTQRDTAITFNYNRPDNEPPQSMLLVTSAIDHRHLAVG